MYPIIVLSLTGLITLFLGLSKNKYLLPITAIFLVLSLVSNFYDWGKPGFYFGQMVETSNFIILVQSILIITTVFIVFISQDQFEDIYAHPAEYYAILQFSLVGALIMVSFQNMVMLFLGLEILSVSLYVLTGSDKRNLRGNEAAIKYFLMGAFATGILLFGIAMLYGGTGTFDIGLMSGLAKALPNTKIFMWIGLVFILIGLLFKVSAAPFHFWTADVYQGAPTIFTAYMATIVKTAGFFALFRVFGIALHSESVLWSKILLGIIFLSLLIGNLTAVYQSNYKRMLAFSSISQAGFMLFALLGLGNFTASGLAFYSASYALATITAFGVYLVVSKTQIENGRPNENIEVFIGLFSKNPFLAVVLLISMLSLSGIPLTSGFWSKFFVFNDTASKGYVWIIVFAVIMSAVSIYFYFKPIRAAFLKATSDEKIIIPSYTKYILLISTILTVVLGIFPDLLRGLLKL